MARSRLIHLSRCTGVSRKILREMIQLDRSLKSFYELNIGELVHSLNIDRERARKIALSIQDTAIKREIKKDLSNCGIITILDPIYPQSLKNIQDPPLVLYTLGDLNLLNHLPSISVIGTRKPTAEAYHKTNYIVEPLARNNWTVISGMARGIDSFAHEAALKSHGKTIAVLGGGFSHIYPAENINLFNKIVQKGLVISEYPPSLRPRQYHFPERNRIISGLSFGVVVIEAKTRSGTLITVDQALDQGREVYALPGSPLNRETRGCNELIKDGAILVMSADDIVEDWHAIGLKQLGYERK